MNSFSVSPDFKDVKGQFIAALVHELRNPLANITLSAELLNITVPNSDVENYTSIIMRNSTRINNLIVQLLKYEKADEVQLEEYSICDLLDEVLDLNEDRIKLKKITVIKKYAEKDYRIIANRPKIKIALTNIIINAIEAISHADGQLTLVTKLVFGKYVIQVMDNGCGISKEHLGYLFKTNFTSKPNGLGLGLSIIYDILQSNGIGINVESEEGKGSCFTLLFDNDNYYNAFQYRKI